jgi:hypothetical protein
LVVEHGLLQPLHVFDVFAEKWKGYLHNAKDISDNCVVKHLKVSCNKK